MLLSYGWRWKKEVSAKYTLNQLFNYCYSYFARRHNFRNPCQLSLSKPKRRERKGVGGKIGIITHVRTYMRT